MDKKFLYSLLLDSPRSLVGKLCNICETIQESEEFKSNSQLLKAISLIKSLQKELVYQEFRGLSKQLDAFADGVEYQYFKIYKPTSK